MDVLQCAIAAFIRREARTALCGSVSWRRRKKATPPFPRGLMPPSDPWRAWRRNGQLNLPWKHSK
eukprot:2048195-Amphidinium_carterae.1